MEQTLEGFIREWNETHRHFVFSVQVAPVVGCPTDVEIRYPAAKYHDFYSTENWDKLEGVVEAMSHHTMYVTTDERLFQRGIISIKIAPMNHNYQETFIAGVLKWIGEKFFPE